MTIFKKYSFSIVLFLLLANMVFAQTMKVTVSKNKLSLGEYVEVKYTIEGGSDSGFKTGNFKDFEIAQGPNSSSNMQWVNGKFSQSKTYSYVLRPKIAGSLIIPQAQVKIKGKLFRTNPKKILVVKDALYAQQQKKAKANEGTLEDFVYLKVEAAKDTIYKGEQLIANYNLYTAYQVKNFNITDLPTFTGFWQRDLIEGHYPQRTKMINGKQFTVVTLKKIALFPQITGKVDLEPITIEGDVRVKQSNTAGRYNNFSAFGRFKNIHKKITSEPFDLVVLPLPKPEVEESFTGAVGNFSIGANLSKRSVKTDEAVTLKFTISGDGNLKLFDAPNVVLPKELESYDVKVQENIYTNAGSVRGSKIFEFPIIPRKPGRFTIPAVEWSFFDIKTEKYKSFKVGPYTLHVQPGDDYSDNESTYVETKSTINAIKTNGLEIEKASSINWITKPIGVLFAFLPILMMPVLFLVRRQKEINKPSEQQIKYSAANKVAIKKLQKAKGFVNNDNDKLFYDEVIHSIWGYMNGKFDLQNSEMNKENIYNTLLKNNIEPHIADQTKQLVSNCEMSIFAPGAVSFNKQEIYDQAVSILSNIEDELKDEK